jgi:hypothetical protein
VDFVFSAPTPDESGRVGADLEINQDRTVWRFLKTGWPQKLPTMNKPAERSLG